MGVWLLGVVVGGEKGRPGNEVGRGISVLCSVLGCGSVTGSNGAWFVSGPPKSYVPVPRVSGTVSRTRGEAEVVVAGEGGWCSHLCGPRGPGPTFLLQSLSPSATPAPRTQRDSPCRGLGLRVCSRVFHRPQPLVFKIPGVAAEVALSFKQLMTDSHPNLVLSVHLYLCWGQEKDVCFTLSGSENQ